MPLGRWGGGWLGYGELDKSGIWHFDKERIRHELVMRLHENELCPALNSKQAIETLEEFPSSINPKNDPNWEYETRYEEVRGTYKDVAVGIQPVFNKATRYIIGDYKPNWDFEVEDYEVDDYDVDSGRNDRSTVTYKVQMGSIPGDGKKAKTGCLGVVVLSTAIALVVIALWIL